MWGIGLGAADTLLDRFNGARGSLLKPDREAPHVETPAGLHTITGLGEEGEGEEVLRMLTAVGVDEGAEGEGVLTVRSKGEGELEACEGLELA